MEQVGEEAEEDDRDFQGMMHAKGRAMGWLCGVCAWDPIGSILERWIAKDTPSWRTAAACIVMGAGHSRCLELACSQ